MFTGLVEATATVVRATGVSPRRLTLASNIALTDVQLGESIAVDGCCLTVVAADSDGLTFEAATETLARTTLGTLQVGMPVHLERALRFGDRLGGHLVAGHIDCVGTLQGRDMRGSALYLTVDVGPTVAQLTAPRGSITFAGVSLTVTDVQQNLVSVGLIPHTLAVTHLGQLAVGAGINVEADLLARYVARLLEPAARPSA